MRIVITGASGNLGTAVLARLAEELPDAEVSALARRSPEAAEALSTPERTEWVERDLRTDDLAAVLESADAVVHLAWAFHPARLPDETWRTNVLGSRRVLDAADRAGVGQVLAVSSVAAYSQRLDLEPVDERWPTDGASEATYAREKAYVERLLDTFEASHPSVVLTRMRPVFVFQAAAAEEQRRIFAGSLAPTRLAIRAAALALPLPTGLALQAVHADDVAAAIVAAVHRHEGGVFNLAGDGILRDGELQQVFGGRPVELPAPLLRSLMAAGFAARILPADPRLFDALLRVPMLSTQRARERLDWQPRQTGSDALRSLRTGLLNSRGAPTPPLQAG